MKIDFASLRGLEAHEAADADLVARLAELDTEANGQAFSDAQRAEFEQIVEDRATLKATIDELKTRKGALDAAMADTHATEPVRFNVPNIKKGVENVHDLAAYREQVRSVDELPNAYRDGAMRVIESAILPTAVDADKAKARLAKLVERHKGEDYGAVSRRIIGTSDPKYVEAWGSYIRSGGQMPGGRLQAVLQTYSDSDGGFAIPVTIDPTFINVSDGTVNPLRSISRIETITTKSWQAVTTEGVTAAYVGERTTSGAADGAPSDVDDPTATPVRADVAVDVSLEYLADYGSAALLSEIGSLIATSKDDLEADKFVQGNGSGEPEGIIWKLDDDGNSIVETATNDVYALEDVDSLIAALGPRFRSRAQFMANLAIYQITRGFGDAGQTAGTIYDPVSKVLRGYAANEASSMDDVATDGKEILLLGDFSKFVIVDRLGLTTRVLDTRDTNGRPTGGSTIYAAWRNTTKVLAVNAFRLLKVK